MLVWVGRVEEREEEWRRHWRRHGDEYDLKTFCECMNFSKIDEKIPFKASDGTDKENLKIGFQPLQCINLTLMCWRTWLAPLS